MRAYRRLAFVLAVAIVAFSLAGCAPTPPSAAPTIPNGVITSMNAGADGLGSVLVESDDPDTTFDKASVSVTDKTTLLRETDNGYVEAVFAELAEGTRVDVWITGPVAESYPVQASADAMVVLR
ncbi:MAG: DUF3221 domain-containing protein [Coriobacteriia bacterium]